MQATIAGIRYDTERAILVGPVTGGTLYASPRATNFFILDDDPKPGRTGIRPVEKTEALALTLSQIGRDRAVEVFGADVVKASADDDLRAEVEKAMESLSQIRAQLVDAIWKIDKTRAAITEKIEAFQPPSTPRRRRS